MLAFRLEILSGFAKPPGRTPSSGVLWAIGNRPVPGRPIWPGFAINTLFYAVVLWLLLAAPFALRRWRRVKRALCPACAYPVGDSPVCTECGKPVLLTRKFVPVRMEDMPTLSLVIALFVLLVAMASGCAKRDPVQGHPMRASQPSMKWRDEFYCFDDPRCSTDEQRAIRAATKAVFGTDQPSTSLSGRLYFSCTQSTDGWSLTIWEFGPNGEVPPPGGFTAVTLNPGFSVRSIIGGA